MPIYPKVAVLDIAGPVQVFGVVPGLKCLLVAADKNPVQTAEGVLITPDVSFADCPSCTVLMVPGGSGQVEMMVDPAYQGFLKTQAAQAEVVSSVCVGSLLLAVAGLLDGYNATTHWAALSCLQLFPEVRVMPGYPRFVRDRNRVTGGGVSAGIDAALEVVRGLAGDAVADEAELILQYVSEPPFCQGDPLKANPVVLDAATDRLKPLEQARLQQIERLLGDHSAAAHCM